MKTIVDLYYSEPEHLPGVLACLRKRVMKEPGRDCYADDGWTAILTLIAASDASADQTDALVAALEEVRRLAAGYVRSAKGAEANGDAAVATALYTVARDIDDALAAHRDRGQREAHTVHVGEAPYPCGETDEAAEWTEFPARATCLMCLQSEWIRQSDTIRALRSGAPEPRESVDLGALLAEWDAVAYTADQRPELSRLLRGIVQALRSAQGVGEPGGTGG
jgi:hypothetical protein